MDHRFSVNADKCTRCGRCVRECMVKAIRFDRESRLPMMIGDDRAVCINCQHCLAVCPVGALSVNGVDPESCRISGEKPSPETMANLIRQRRSVRKFKKCGIDAETLAALEDILHYTPTGCNDHRLRFFIADRADIDFFRKTTSKWLKFMIKSGIMGLFLPRYRRYFADVLSGVDVIYRGAPHLIVVMAPKNAPCCRTDQVIALTQFDMMAQSLDIGTCWCGFAEYAFRLIPSLRKKIGCPRGFRIGGVMLFGIPDVQYVRVVEPERFIVESSLSDIQ